MVEFSRHDIIFKVDTCYVSQEGSGLPWMFFSGLTGEVDLCCLFVLPTGNPFGSLWGSDLKKKRVAEGGTTAFFFVHSLTKRHSKWFASSKNISIFGVYIQTHVRFFPMVFWGFRRDATGRRITEKHFNQVILFQFFSLRYVIRRLVAGIGLAIKILIYATNSSTILTTRFDLSLFSNLRSVRREQWR